MTATPSDLIPRVFCDLDDVLADFEADIIRRFDLSGPEEIGPLLRRPGIWHEIAKSSPNIFATLPVRKGATQLMSVLTRLRDANKIKLAILTAVPTEWYADESKRATCRRDKQRWVERYFPQVPTRNVIVCRRDQKVNYALKQKEMGTDPPVLIDDFEKNIREWEGIGGGVGILHTDTTKTLAELQQYLTSLEVLRPSS